MAHDNETEVPGERSTSQLRDSMLKLEEENADLKLNIATLENQINSREQLIAQVREELQEKSKPKTICLDTSSILMEYIETTRKQKELTPQSATSRTFHFMTNERQPLMKRSNSISSPQYIKTLPDNLASQISNETQRSNSQESEQLPSQQLFPCKTLRVSEMEPRLTSSVKQSDQYFRNSEMVIQSTVNNENVKGLSLFGKDKRQIKRMTQLSFRSVESDFNWPWMRNLIGSSSSLDFTHLNLRGLSHQIPLQPLAISDPFPPLFSAYVDYFQDFVHTLRCLAVVKADHLYLFKKKTMIQLAKIPLSLISHIFLQRRNPTSLMIQIPHKEPLLIDTFHSVQLVCFLQLQQKRYEVPILKASYLEDIKHSLHGKLLDSLLTPALRAKHQKAYFFDFGSSQLKGYLWLLGKGGFLKSPEWEEKIVLLTRSGILIMKSLTDQQPRFFPLLNTQINTNPQILKSLPPLPYEINYSVRKQAPFGVLQLLHLGVAPLTLLFLSSGDRDLWKEQISHVQQCYEEASRRLVKRVEDASVVSLE